MKIKLDFITNSSSVCYLISSPKKIKIVEVLYDRGIPPSKIDYFIEIDNKKALIEQALSEGATYDWITEAIGPYRFWGLSKNWYEKSLKVIQEGNIVCLVDLDRSDFKIINRFEAIILNEGASIIGVESG